MIGGRFLGRSFFFGLGGRNNRGTKERESDSKFRRDFGMRVFPTGGVSAIISPHKFRVPRNEKQYSTFGAGDGFISCGLTWNDSVRRDRSGSLGPEYH